MSPAAESAAMPVATVKTTGEAVSVHARYARASCTATPDASGNARPRSGTNAGHVTATASPAASANPSERRSARLARTRSRAPTCRPTRAIVPTSNAMKTLQSDHSIGPATCIAASDASAW